MERNNSGQSKKQELVFTMFLGVLPLACVVIAMALGACGSREHSKNDRPGMVEVVASNADAAVCSTAPPGPWVNTVETASLGNDPEPLAVGPTPTCDEAAVAEAGPLRKVWQRALDYIGPQDPTKPPSARACQTARVLQRIGVAEAEAIVSRCPAMEADDAAPAAATDRSSPRSSTVSRRAPERLGLAVSGNGTSTSQQAWN